MATATKSPHPRRNHSNNSRVQAFVLCLLVLLVLAAVVGLILALNSKMFVEPR